MDSDIYQNSDLSGQGIILKPTYNKHAFPTALEKDDRVFDPRRECKTHSAQVVGSIQDRQLFSQPFHDKESLALWLIIKRPMSDIYHLPKELKPYKEFVQTVMNYEHNKTPAAFTRAATLYIRQGTGTDTTWHYDTLAEEKSPSWHYICSSALPTKGRILTFSKKHLESVIFDGSFSALYDLTDFDTPEKTALKSAQFMSQPYQITRHSSSCLHKGTPATESHDRTFASVSFVDLADDEYGYDYYDSPLMNKFKKTYSAPYEDSPDILRHQVLKR
jgi:hypothetical protein